MLENLKQKAKKFIGEENLELFVHSRNYLSGTVTAKILTAVCVIPIFTRILSVADYAVLSLFFTASSLLVIFFGLDISSGIVRYYLEKRPDFGKTLSSNLIFVYICATLGLSLVYLFRNQCSKFFGLDPDVLLLAAGLAALQVGVEIYMAYLSGSKQSRKFALITLVRTAAALGISIALMLWLKEKRYFGRIAGELFVMTVLGVYVIAALIKLSKLSFSFKRIQYCLRYSIPLIPHTISRQILGYFDRIIIQQLTNATFTGLYSFAYDVGMAINIVVMDAGRAWRPIFFEEYRLQNYAKLSRMARDYANNIYMIALFIILFAKDGVYILADKKFHSVSNLIPIIVLGYVFVFLYTLYFQYTSYLKRTELISVSTIIAGIINIVLNYLLIPIYGYQIAAYTTLVSYGFLFVLHYCNARFVLKANVIPLKMILPNFGILAIITALITFFDNWNSHYWLFFLIKVATTTLAIVYYFKTKPLKKGS